jgi:hypothetical protein
VHDRVHNTLANGDGGNRPHFPAPNLADQDFLPIVLLKKAYGLLSGAGQPGTNFGGVDQPRSICSFEAPSSNPGVRKLVETLLAEEKDASNCRYVPALMLSRKPERSECRW